MICSHSGSVQGRCAQDTLNTVLTWNVRTSPAEYTKVQQTFGTCELLHQDSALIECSAEEIAFTLQTESTAVGIKNRTSGKFSCTFDTKEILSELLTPRRCNALLWKLRARKETSPCLCTLAGISLKSI